MDTLPKFYFLFGRRVWVFFFFFYLAHESECFLQLGFFFSGSSMSDNHVVCEVHTSFK